MTKELSARRKAPVENKVSMAFNNKEMNQIAEILDDYQLIRCDKEGRILMKCQECDKEWKCNHELVSFLLLQKDKEREVEIVEKILKRIEEVSEDKVKNGSLISLFVAENFKLFSNWLRDEFLPYNNPKQ